MALLMCSRGFRIKNCCDGILGTSSVLKVFLTTFMQQPSDSLLCADLRLNSTLAAEFKKATTSASSSKRPLFRTTESDPANHASRHDGFFYTVPPAEFDRWMSRGLHVQFYKAMRGFNEASIMIRSPAIEILNGLKSADYSAPSVRYLLYGLEGCGKSTTLAHIAHFCGRQGWFIAHDPWSAFHNRYYRDTQPSTHKPGRIDQPLDSADWLAYFRKLNEPLLSKANSVPVTVDRYVWTKRETAEVGTPLVELIDFGLGRVKFAPDVMGAILKELRLQASAGQWRVLAAIDGVNAIWSTTTIKREDDRSKRYHPTELGMNQHWMRLLDDGWSGGAVVCTVDGLAAQPADRNRFLPLNLLGSEAFQFLDPFVPIHVPVYNEREVFSCIEYYRDRRWIQRAHGGTEDGRKELIALSGNNPMELYRVCINW